MLSDAFAKGRLPVGPSARRSVSSRTLLPLQPGPKPAPRGLSKSLVPSPSLGQFLPRKGEGESSHAVKG